MSDTLYLALRAAHSSGLFPTRSSAFSSIERGGSTRLSPSGLETFLEGFQERSRSPLREVVVVRHEGFEDVGGYAIWDQPPHADTIAGGMGRSKQRNGREAVADGRELYGCCPLHYAVR